MKTTTLTIRLSAADKEMLQTAARSRGLTVTDYLLQLARADAGPDQTAPTTLAHVKAELADLRREVAELNPIRINQEIQELRQMMDVVADQATPTPVPSEYFAPGAGRDCNQSCKWFAVAPKRCKHPDFADIRLDNFRVIPGICPNYEPNK